jgi:hypothetical protein
MHKKRFARPGNDPMRCDSVTHKGDIVMSDSECHPSPARLSRQMEPAHEVPCREIREQHVVNPFKAPGLDLSITVQPAQQLRRLSGLYDQAARAAASL